jgi:tetratricopeptide (TPR) repeat protein
LPNLPNSADTLGWAYYHEGAYNSAIDTFQQAIKGDPNNPTYHYHLGLAYEKSKQAALARAQLEQTLKIDPKYAQASDIKEQLAGPLSHN